MIKKSIIPSVNIRVFAVAVAILVLAFAGLAIAPAVSADVVKGNTYGNVAAVQARLSTRG